MGNVGFGGRKIRNILIFTPSLNYLDIPAAFAFPLQIELENIMRHRRSESGCLKTWLLLLSPFRKKENFWREIEAPEPTQRLLLKHHMENARGFQFVSPKAGVALTSYIRKQPFRLPAAAFLSALHKSLAGILGDRKQLC